MSKLSNPTFKAAMLSSTAQGLLKAAGVGRVVHAGTYGAAILHKQHTGSKVQVYLAPAGTLVWVSPSTPKQAFKKPRGLAKAKVVQKHGLNGGTVQATRKQLSRTTYAHPTKGKTQVGNNLNWLIQHGYAVVVQKEGVFKA